MSTTTVRKALKGLLLLILFLLIGFALDRAGYALVERGMPDDTRAFYQAKRAFYAEKQDASVLIMGDSRAAGGLDPKLIEDATGKTAFNLSVYSTGPYQWRRVLKTAFANMDKLPEYVVIGATPKMFGRGVNSGTNYLQAVYYLRPDLQYQVTPNPDSVLTLNYLSCLYRNKDILLSQIGAFFRQKSTATSKRIVTDTYQGFLYFYNAGSVDENDGDVITMDLLPDVVAEFDAMLGELKALGVQTIVMQMPYWHMRLARFQRSPGYEAYLAAVDETCAKYGVPVVNADMSALQDELLATDYVDNGHVNAYGAEKFTRYFMSEVGWE